MKDFMFSGHVCCLGVSQQKCLPSFVILFYVGMEIKRKNEFGRRPANIDWILLYHCVCHQGRMLVIMYILLHSTAVLCCPISYLYSVTVCIHTY